MTAEESKNRPAWHAELKWERRFIPIVTETLENGTDEMRNIGPVKTSQPNRTVRFQAVSLCYVEVSRPGSEPIRFRVNSRKDRSLSFTDPREQAAGTIGVTGPWGTRPAPRVVKPRSLTPTRFREEVRRLIGPERTEEIIRSVSEADFFWTDL